MATLMGLHTFVEALLEPRNCALCPSANSVEGMGGHSEPLPSYWVCASHNSFLVGHQLNSRSSADMLRRLLLQRVRSIEIDCWDGRTTPIVTHGEEP